MAFDSIVETLPRAVLTPRRTLIGRCLKSVGTLLSVLHGGIPEKSAVSGALPGALSGASSGVSSSTYSFQQRRFGTVPWLTRQHPTSHTTREHHPFRVYRYHDAIHVNITYMYTSVTEVRWVAMLYLQLLLVNRCGKGGYGAYDGPLGLQ